MKRNFLFHLIVLAVLIFQSKGLIRIRNQVLSSKNNITLPNINDKILKQFGIRLDLPSNKMIQMHSNEALFRPISSNQAQQNQTRNSFDIRKNLNEINELKLKKAIKLKQSLTNNKNEPPIFKTMQKSAKLVDKQLHFLTSIVDNLTGLKHEPQEASNESNAKPVSIIAELKKLTKNLNTLINELELIKQFA